MNFTVQLSFIIQRAVKIFKLLSGLHQPSVTVIQNDVDKDHKPVQNVQDYDEVEVVNDLVKGSGDISEKYNVQE
jgi:hypothetical protein